jgi:hypothetical protein
MKVLPVRLLPMKRLVWVVLAAFCVAFGQVQSVCSLDVKAKCCSCCRPGACGMQGCCPGASSASLAFKSAQTSDLARQAVPRRARLVWAGQSYVSFAALAELSAMRHAPALVLAPAANVPLYVAHCSHLI